MVTGWNLLSLFQLWEQRFRYFLLLFCLDMLLEVLEGPAYNDVHHSFHEDLALLVEINVLGKGGRLFAVTAFYVICFDASVSTMGIIHLNSN